jgi:hypothetical protein
MAVKTRGGMAGDAHPRDYIEGRGTGLIPT